MNKIKHAKTLTDRQLLEMIYNSIIVIHKRLDIIEDKIFDGNMRDTQNKFYYNDTLEQLKSEIAELESEFKDFELDK